MEENQNYNNQVSNIVVESKKGIGFCLGFLLGLIGLIIGLLLYKDGSYERESFFRGWWIGYSVRAVFTIVLYVLTWYKITKAINIFYIINNICDWYYESNNALYNDLY